MKVGVVIPNGPDAPGGQVYGWDHLRRFAETADASGLDSIWVYDHLLFRFPGRRAEGIHEAWTVLSALASVTQRVTLGTIVLAMPFRNPALLAKMAVTLDEVSGERLVLGVGAGWHEPEFQAFDYPFDHRVGRFEEALHILLPLIREGRADFSGRWHTARDAQLIPWRRRADGSTIPILIAGKRPRMLGLVAQHADAWNTAWLGPATDLPPRLAPLDAALQAAGRERSSLEVTVGVSVVLEGAEDGALGGSVEELADAFTAYRQAGADHLICSLEPATPGSVEHVAQAAELAAAP
ncbi:MAG TPA: LLM class flavin-dependent oxidoreductase [Candidatus Limnocylindria bacterium]|nr:LLM class flavin-dependent oxidoreductase [Candidatus Limnocylindria bacterium]